MLLEQELAIASQQQEQDTIEVFAARPVAHGNIGDEVDDQGNLTRNTPKPINPALL